MSLIADRRVVTARESRLPDVPPEPQLADARDTKHPEDAPLAGLRVLVVDDDPDALELVAYSLQKRGARVTSACDAFEAFDLALLERPDVLVSDIGMPGRDGYSLVRSIRERETAPSSRLPAIALTAFGTARDAASAVAAGFDVHMRKPVDLEALCNNVRFLARSRPSGTSHEG